MKRHAWLLLVGLAGCTLQTETKEVGVPGPPGDPGDIGSPGEPGPPGVSPFSFVDPVAKTDIYYSSGKVGIGTPKPKVELHVSGHFGTNAASGFFVENVDTNRFLRAGWAGGNSPYPRLVGDVGLGLAGQDNNTDALFVGGDGNVGIGTTTPTAPLEVNARTTGAFENILYLNQSHGGSYGYVFKVDNVISGDLYLQRRELDVEPNGEILTFSHNGELGIGAVAPSARLHVQDSANLPSVLDIASYAPFKITDGSAAILMDTNQIESVGGDLYLNDRAPGKNVILATGGGSVGIGTMSPQALLHVAGKILADDTITPSDARLKDEIEPSAHPLTDSSNFEVSRSSGRSLKSTATVVANR